MWQLQEAKNKFSQVVAAAMQDGPQIITRHGVEVAVLLAYPEYKRIVSSSQQAQIKLSQFFRQSPLVDGDLNFSRDSSEARASIDL